MNEFDDYEKLEIVFENDIDEIEQEQEPDEPFKIYVNPDEEFFEKISKKVKDNDGYCPCMLVRNKDTKCMCKEFMDKQENGFCRCRRYYKLDSAIPVKNKKQLAKYIKGEEN